MSRIIPFDALVILVRLKLYEALAIDGVLFCDVVALGEKLDRRATGSFITSALAELEKGKHVELRPGKNGTEARLLPTGIRNVEKQLADPQSAAAVFRDEGWEAIDDISVRLTSAPASDRIVTLDHNSAPYAEAKTAIAEIRTALEQNSEVGQAFGDEKAVALSEITQLQNMIDQPKVRAPSLVAYARKCLGWMAEKGAGTIMAELSKKLLALIISWIS